MGKPFCVAAFSSFILFLSCNKISSKSAIVDLTSPKKWILVEALADPGDGSGKWNPVDKQNYYFIKFNVDGSVETNTYTGLGRLTQYKMVNDSSINFVYANGNIFNLLYKINGSLLTISGGCYEACGSKFRADL